MPKKAKQRKIAPRSGKSVLVRKIRARQRRKGCVGNAATVAAPIASSLHTVRFSPKPGIEVFDKIHAKKPRLEGGDDYFKMYQDLKKCLHRAFFIVKGEKTGFDPLAGGIGIGMSLKSIIDAFERNILPEGFQFEVSNEGGYDYCFTVFKFCSFPGHWHVFQIKPIVEYLKDDPAMHDLFIDLIGYMASRLEILTWYNGALGYADFAAEDQLMNWADEYGDFQVGPDATAEEHREAAISKEEYEAARECVASYSNGEPAHYARLLKDAHSGLTMLRRRTAALKRGGIKGKLIAWMKDMLEFMKEPGSIHDYKISELNERQFGEEGLSFDRQVAILWDWDDYMTSLEAKSIDVEEMNFGVTPPVLFHYFTPHTTKESLKKLDGWDLWPKQLSELWLRYNTIVETLPGKRKRK